MYTVRTPFRVPTKTRISSDEFATSDGRLSWSIKSNDPYHILTVDGFLSEQEATTFVERLPAALAHLLLERGIVADAALRPRAITYFPDPVAAAENFSQSFGVTFDAPLDGLIDGSAVAIYPSEKRLRIITGGFGSVYSTMPAQHALEIVLAGANFAGALRLNSDPKLSTALELYGAYFTEHSARARFLTLIMALEALTMPTKKSKIALDLLSRWRVETRSIIQSIAGYDADVASLEALERELLFRQEDSIGIQIRKVVDYELRSDSDVTEQVREAKRLYNLRSTLVHEGFLDASILVNATSSAKTLVHRVLSSRFRRITSGVLESDIDSNLNGAYADLNGNEF